jgi:hypothetical protein
MGVDGVSGSSSADASAAAWAEGTISAAESYAQEAHDNGPSQPGDGVDGEQTAAQRAQDEFWKNDPNRPAAAPPSSPSAGDGAAGIGGGGGNGTAGAGGTTGQAGDPAAGGNAPAGGNGNAGGARGGGPTTYVVNTGADGSPSVTQTSVEIVSVFEKLPPPLEAPGSTHWLPGYGDHYQPQPVPEPPPPPSETAPPVGTEAPPADEAAKTERKPIDAEVVRKGEMPDRKGRVSDPKAVAKTEIVWSVKADGKKGTATVEIGTQTTYRDPKDKGGTSAYGRGTTAEDKKAGNTSVGFHEQQHRNALEQYMNDHPPPEPNFSEGMSTAEINRETARYDKEMAAYVARANAATAPAIDEAGYPKSKYDRE